MLVSGAQYSYSTSVYLGKRSPPRGYCPRDPARLFSITDATPCAALSSKHRTVHELARDPSAGAVVMFPARSGFCVCAAKVSTLLDS